jgi:hypothetical protein
MVNPGMAMNPVTITVEFESEEQAAYAHMFLRRCGFEEFYNRTEPHFEREVRKERAYQIRDALGRIERALQDADVPSSIY